MSNDPAPHASAVLTPELPAHDSNVPERSDGHLPALTLPPAPFSRAVQARTEQMHAPGTAAARSTSDHPDLRDAEARNTSPAFAHAPVEGDRPAAAGQALHEPVRICLPSFTAPDRPGAYRPAGPSPHGGDRRRTARGTHDRRATPRTYASPWMARPHEGSLDPRPQHAPITEPRLIRPLDARLPDIPVAPVDPASHTTVHTPSSPPVTASDPASTTHQVEPAVTAAPIVPVEVSAAPAAPEPSVAVSPPKMSPAVVEAVASPDLWFSSLPSEPHGGHAELSLHAASDPLAAIYGAVPPAPTSASRPAAAAAPAQAFPGLAPTAPIVDGPAPLPAHLPVDAQIETGFGEPQLVSMQRPPAQRPAAVTPSMAASRVAPGRGQSTLQTPASGTSAARLAAYLLVPGVAGVTLGFVLLKLGFV